MQGKILIVDDVKNNRILLNQILATSFEVEVEEADDGASAVEKAKKTEYDIVFMDVMMPNMNGFVAAKKILETKANVNTKIIFVTGHDENKENFDHAIDVGGIDYITKPFDISEITKLIALYLRFVKKEKDYLKQLIETNSKLEEAIDKGKVLEDELTKAKENFKSIVEKSDAAIIIVNEKGYIKFVNQSGKTVFGRSEDELLNREFGVISNFDSKAQINIIRKDEEIGVGEITTTKTLWENEPAWLVLINDITEHKRLEDNLMKAKEQAQESDRLKSAFLSNMSHEIRTPMNGILGFIDFIETEENPKKRQEFANIIRNSGNHLLNLINDIIDISKIESGQLDIKYEVFLLNGLMLSLCDLFSSNEKIVDKSIGLEPVIPVRENDIAIKTDPYRLKQVLINLIGNALKFTEAGKVSYGYHIKNNKLIFFVKDTGIGIPKDKIKDIFNRFSQVEDKKKRFTKGTGLGLAISKSLVNLMGGDIWVESELDIGSSFYFDIPFKENMPINLKVKEEKISIALDDWKNKCILIAEDQVINFHLLESLLTKSGVKLLWAQNGVEALQKYQNNKPDLILMDIKMPLMDGLKATQKIRQLDKNVPIIAQTAFALLDEKAKCLKAGCNDYISKPIKKDVLFQKINNCLKQYNPDPVRTNPPDAAPK